MAEVDLERLVLPALLALVVLGTFMVLVTSGGSEKSPAPVPAQSIAAAAAMSVDELNPSIDPDSLRAGRTLQLAR